MLQQNGIEAGVPTGFIEIDKLTNGLRAGQIIIVAARPGVGKSTLAGVPCPTTHRPHGPSGFCESVPR